MAEKKKTTTSSTELTSLKNRLAKMEEEINSIKETLENRTLKVRIQKLLHSKWFHIGVMLSSFVLTFLLFDFVLRLLSNKATPFYRTRSLSPLLFSLSYILLLGSILYCIGLKKGKYIYGAVASIFGILTFIQIFHLKILDRFFGINDIFLAKEGSDYLSYVVSIINLKMIFLAIVIVALIAFTIFMMNKVELPNTSFKIKVGIILLSFFCILCMRGIAIQRYGKSVPYTQWDSWNYPKNIYNSFSNNNRSMQVAGLYEYTFRSITKYLGSKFSNETAKEREIVATYFEKRKKEMKYEKNEYSDLFKNKNLIMVMLESTDGWTINKEAMPTLTRLRDTGLNFTNKYAPVFGGGATFNSEFSSLTSLYTPNNGMAAFNYDKNNFDFSLPNLFRKNGYQANSFHMNHGSFYNRTSIHERMGFEKHYALLDLYPNVDWRYDSNLVKEEEIYSKIVPKEGKFMSFITTYSMHLPYDDSNELVRTLKKTDQYKQLKVEEEELTAVRLLSRETDDFFTILLEKLEKDKKLDDTVLVIFTDHSLYGYSKKAEVKENVDDANLVNHEPLIIWSKDIEAKQIDTILDTADLTPTIANLFGLSFEPAYYLGTDVFSHSHDPYVYFNNYNWYDLTYYFKGDPISDADQNYIKKVSEEVNEKISINDKILSSDYFSTIKLNS